MANGGGGSIRLSTQRGTDDDSDDSQTMHWALNELDL